MGKSLGAQRREDAWATGTGAGVGGQPLACAGCSQQPQDTALRIGLQQK